MASVVLGVGGAIVGGLIGGPIGAAIGGALGSAIGGRVDNMLFNKGSNQFQEGPRLSDLTVMTSAFGTPIPRLYGPSIRIAAQIIDTSGIIEDYHDQWQQTGGGKGGGGGGSVTQRTYTYRVTLACLLGAGPFAGITRIWANKRNIYGPSGSGGFETVRFYPGNGSQAIDSDLASIHGSNTPAYRHSSWILIKNLQLADYGNAIPQIEVEVVAHSPSITVGAVVQDICEAAGIENVSANNLSQELKGYGIARSSSAIEALQPLALAYNFDAAEQCGDVRMVRRGLGLRAVIPIEDMGVVVAGDEKPASPIEVTRGHDLELPRQVTVTYSDVDFDFQQGSQIASRTRGNTENNLSQQLPLVLTATEARTIADRLMFEAWAGRRSATFNVSDHWIGLRAADVVGLPIAGEVVPFKLIRGTRGQDGVIELEARYEDSEVYSSDAAGGTPVLPPNAYADVGDTFLYPFNAPLLTDSNDNNGFYWAVDGASTTWRGADVERSIDAGVTWFSVSGAAVRAVIGDVATPLADGPFGFIDEGNTLEVVLQYPGHTLSGVTEMEMFNGANTAWLGRADGSTGEVFSFRDAELIAPSTYRLSGLIRGRRGTDHAMAGHVADEVFVLINRSTIARTDYGTGDWDSVKSYRATSVTKDAIDSDVITFTNTGEAQRPFAPVHVTATRDGSDNLSIAWVRRSRLSSPGLVGPVPLGEESEAYEVDVLDGVTVVRTISTAAASASYSAADQTTDGLTPGDPVSIIVYQLSTVRGRGHGREATV